MSGRRVNGNVDYPIKDCEPRDKRGMFSDFLV